MDLTKYRAAFEKMDYDSKAGLKVNIFHSQFSSDLI